MLLFQKTFGAKKGGVPQMSFPVLRVCGEPEFMSGRLGRGPRLAVLARLAEWRGLARAREPIRFGDMKPGVRGLSDLKDRKFFGPGDQADGDQG